MGTSAQLETHFLVDKTTRTPRVVLDQDAKVVVAADGVCSLLVITMMALAKLGRVVRAQEAAPLEISSPLPAQ